MGHGAGRRVAAKGVEIADALAERLDHLRPP
jgi:hypothetical protein